MVKTASAKKIFLVNIGCPQPAYQLSWPRDHPLRVVCNLNIFNESWLPKPEKSEFKIDRGLYFFVSICLRLSYYYHFKIIRPLKKASSRFSALGLSRSTDFRSESGVKNIPNRKPLKSYTNPAIIITLLLVLHEQFKFYVPHYGRALVPCRLVCGQIWH